MRAKYKVPNLHTECIRMYFVHTHTRGRGSETAMSGRGHSKPVVCYVNSGTLSRLRIGISAIR